MILIKKRYWALLTGLLFLLLIFVAVPASWTIYGIQKAAPGFQVANVSGSLWNGKAGYSQWLDRGKVLPLGELSWRLSPWSLIVLNPCLNFSTRASGQTISGNACFSLLSGSARASNLEIRLPMEAITAFFSVEMEGAVDAFVTKAVWKSNRLGATEFTVLWQNASIYNGSQWIALGNIQGKGNDDDQGGLFSQWKSTQTPGERSPVTIDLQARLTNLHQSSPNMTINGTVTPGPDPRALGPMLQFIGERERNGAYRIAISE